MCISIKKDKKELLFNFKREKHRQSKIMLPNKFFSVNSKNRILLAGRK